MKIIFMAAMSAAIVLPAPFVSAAGKISSNEFNPAISLTIDGRHTSLDEEDLSLAGFQLGGEAELPEKGFSTGHNELSISSNIDDKFYGSMSTAIIYRNNETTVELEEAYIETLSLGSGFKVKAGKFFSGIGYLNSIHDHAHDFADRPLVYDALFGGHLTDTGIQANWVAPTDFYLSFGAEVLRGDSFPGGDNNSNDAGNTVFVKTGGDFSESSSWQMGLSHYSSEFDVREGGGHAHGGAAAAADNELKNGDVDIAGIDFIYKWAPSGNSKERNFKIQMEYYVRDENGEAEFTEGNNSAEANYDGEQKGYYIQSVYQFMPKWRFGIRYDHLEADNNITNFVDNGIEQDEFEEESGFGVAGDPERSSVMIDYSPSHFSRIRLQFSEFDNGRTTDDIVTVQYLMSLGSHGAHTF